MKLNVANCIKNQKDLDMQPEVFTKLQGEEQERKLQYLLESKIQSLAKFKRYVEEGYTPRAVFSWIDTLEKEIAIMTAGN